MESTIHLLIVPAGKVGMLLNRRRPLYSLELPGIRRRRLTAGDGGNAAIAGAYVCPAADALERPLPEHRATLVSKPINYET